MSAALIAKQAFTNLSLLLADVSQDMVPLMGICIVAAWTSSAVTYVRFCDFARCSAAVCSARMYCSPSFLILAISLAVSLLSCARKGITVCYFYCVLSTLWKATFNSNIAVILMDVSMRPTIFRLMITDQWVFEALGIRFQAVMRSASARVQATDQFFTTCPSLGNRADYCRGYDSFPSKVQ